MRCMLFALLFVVALVSPAIAQQAQAVLSWTDVQGEDTYRIERSDAGSPYAVVGTTAMNVVTFTNGPLALATQYCWRIVSVNAFGEGAPSAPACAQADTPGQVLGVQVLLSPAP